MSQHIPALDYYSNELPLVSKAYASSEAFFGINVNPLSKPQHVSYTFLPNMSYFEFIEVDEDGGTTGEIVDLVNVKLGSYYEPLVTNFSEPTTEEDISKALARATVPKSTMAPTFYNLITRCWWIIVVSWRNH
ncbi:BnaC08g41940D [Brassica napus]|uniref:BnaC08g41940D protein n=1 Tax=Brassica napus TaxID=3708 RepID=A0A078H7Y9_BRANA|nr:BnaC08g41940D [Brassica napus]